MTAANEVINQREYQHDREDHQIIADLAAEIDPCNLRQTRDAGQSACTAGDAFPFGREDAKNLRIGQNRQRKVRPFQSQCWQHGDGCNGSTYATEQHRGEHRKPKFHTQQRRDIRADTEKGRVAETHHAAEIAE